MSLFIFNLFKKKPLDDEVIINDEDEEEIMSVLDKTEIVDFNNDMPSSFDWNSFINNINSKSTKFIEDSELEFLLNERLYIDRIIDELEIARKTPDFYLDKISTFNKIMAIYNEYIEFIDKERKEKI